MNHLIETNFVAHSSEQSLAELEEGFRKRSMSSDEVADMQDKCINLAGKFIHAIPVDVDAPIQLIRLYAKVKGRGIIDAEVSEVNEIRSKVVCKLRSAVPVVNEYEVLRSIYNVMLKYIADSK